MRARDMMTVARKTTTMIMKRANGIARPRMECFDSCLITLPNGAARLEFHSEGPTVVSYR